MFKILYSTEKYPSNWENYHETYNRDAAIQSYNACIHELELISEHLHVRLENPKGETVRMHSNE